MRGRLKTLQSIYPLYFETHPVENPEQEKASLKLSCRAASEKLTQPHYMDNELCSTQVTYSGKTAAHVSHVDLTGTLLCDSARICVSPTRLQLSYDKSAHLNSSPGKVRAV